MFSNFTFLYTSIIIITLVQCCLGQHEADQARLQYSILSDSIMKILPSTEEELVVEVRILDDELLNKYKNNTDFNYESGPEEADDWITKIKNWINQQIALLRTSETYLILIDYFYYGLMIIGLFLIIRGLIKADRRGLLFGKTNSNKIHMIETEEDISSMNFDELIFSAMESRNYKLAIRYLFLKSLQQLSDKGFIELRNNKTNYQYLSEINNNQIANLFRRTTLRFEWVWYGDFPVDENIMKTSQNEFNDLFGLVAS